MVYELVGYNTDSRYDDIRYREYTNNKKKAELFNKIPKMQFTDSGHGIVFEACELELRTRRKPTIKTMSSYVIEQMNNLQVKNVIPRKKSIKKELMEENTILKERIKKAVFALNWISKDDDKEKTYKKILEIRNNLEGKTYQTLKI